MKMITKKQMVLSVCTAAIAAATAQQKKPNIVVFIADDSGKDYGCYGNPYVKTPNIDKLASQGVRFDKAFVACPQSSPSRIMMMTGLWAHTLGTEDLGTPINETTQIIPSYLKQAGYYTGAMLKTHWGDHGTKQFDFYFNGRDPIYNEPFMTEKNQFFVKYKEFLKKKKDDPFFLWVGFIDPHRPYKEASTQPVHSPKNVKIHPSLVDAPETRQDIADYYDEIHRLDQHIGFMIAELERQKLMDNTIILFLSDNGLPFIKGKAFLYDIGIESPFIAYWKGKIKPGSVHNNGLVSFIDMAPTILNMAGVEKPKEMYGQSMLPLMMDPSKKGRSEIFAERNFHDTEDYARCIRTEKYKLIYNAYPYKLAPITGDMQKAPSWWDLQDAKRENRLNEYQNFIFQFPRSAIELYDLEKDPMEFENLANRKESVPIINKLLSQMRGWQKETKDTDWWEKERDDAVDRLNGVNISPYKRRK